MKQQKPYFLCISFAVFNSLTKISRYMARILPIRCKTQNKLTKFTINKTWKKLKSTQREESLVGRVRFLVHALISLIIKKNYFDLSRQCRKQLKAGEGWGGVTQQKVSVPTFSAFSFKYYVINQNTTIILIYK